MLAEDNAEIARKIYELFNDHDFNSVLEHVAEGAEVELYAEGLSFKALGMMRQLGVIPTPEQAEA